MIFLPRGMKEDNSTKKLIQVLAQRLNLFISSHQSVKVTLLPNFLVPSVHLISCYGSVELHSDVHIQTSYILLIKMLINLDYC